MAWVQWNLIVVSIILQVMVIGALLRGAFKKFPFAFVYSVVLLLTTVADAAVFTNFGRMSPHMYLWSEAVRQLLLFSTVISFIDLGVEKSPRRESIRRYVVAAALLFVVTSVALHLEEVNRLTQIGRDIGVGSVVVNLLLWMLLIAGAKRNHQLLLLTGGLGLQFTGQAIGQSLRQLATPDRNYTLLYAGNLILVISHLIRLYIWWEVFRPKQAVAKKTVKKRSRAAASAVVAKFFQGSEARQAN